MGAHHPARGLILRLNAPHLFAARGPAHPAAFPRLLDATLLSGFGLAASERFARFRLRLGHPDASL